MLGKRRCIYLLKTKSATKPAVKKTVVKKTVAKKPVVKKVVKSTTKTK